MRTFWRSLLSAYALASARGTSCSLDQRRQSRDGTAHSRTLKLACRRSSRWALMCSTCRPFTRSVRRSGRARTIRLQPSLASRAVPGLSAPWTAATRQSIQSSEHWTTSGIWSKLPAPRVWTLRWTSPFSAHRTTRTCGSTLSGFATGLMGRSSMPRTLRRNTRTSIRSISRRTTGASSGTN